MKFDIETLKVLVKSLEENDITEFAFESDEVKLKLKRGEDAVNVVHANPVVHAPVQHVQHVSKKATATAETPKEDINDAHAVCSPMVGTFYAKPSPDADLFVNVGDQIVEGQVLCIVEAMKMMNEIKADKSGTITKVLATDGSPVKKGDKLFLID